MPRAAPPALADAPAPAFPHGVASGDPLPDGVLLWTRVTPSPEAVPGSGLGGAVRGAGVVAEDRGFARVVASGATTAGAGADH
ncbi:PhoD-like phosphatase N-terminal domain-containing protein, partial [Streptomyces hydrogenans]|uniref:PhoD-like phosphatase N-terminal domain-containing protein n=1 Tax=Streptomyces hydrogenans TaxID=1873719 RepID=UPI00345DD3E6